MTEIKMRRTDCMLSNIRAWRMVLCGLYVMCIVQYSDCANCSWPTAFQNEVWHDSGKGDLTFTTMEVTGFSITAYSSTVTSWECFDDTYLASENLLMIRSSTTINAFSRDWYLYLCWQMTELTGVSYRYYSASAQEPNAGQHRVFLSYQSVTKDQVCNTAAGATGSEYNVLVKQGQGGTASQMCPSVILGRFDFNYTKPDGSLVCTDPYHMNVCSNKSVVTFDTPCTDASILYADGDLYCVDSVTVGTDTLIQFFNPQAAVDNSNTYRFACMAMSQDSLSATIVYNNCTNHMTSSVTAKTHDGTQIGASVVFSPYVFCQGGCNWPTGFQSSTWYDNKRGSLTFDTTTMSGWSFTVDSTTITNWECLDTQYFDSEGILLLKATDTFVSLSKTWISYLCLQTTKITDASYSYYQQHSEQPNALGGERITVSESGTLTAKADVCVTSAVVPAAEFQVIVKSGVESTAKQYCATPLLAEMDYVHTDASGTTSCDTTTDDWDVCSDRQIMTFNHTSCSTVVAYSSSGTVWCVHSFLSTYYYQVVYNSGASPNRFACFVVATNGLTASVVNDNCLDGMTPTALASVSGSPVGALLTMTPFAFTTDSGASSSGGGGSIIPMIAGAVVGILALIVAAIIIYCCCIKKKNTVRSSEEKPPLPETPEANGNATSITVEAVEDADNPVFAVNLPRNTLTPLPQPRPAAGQNGITPQRIPAISRP